MAEFLDEIEFIRKQVITLCEILEPIFEDSFSQKVALPSSYMKLTRSAKD